LGTGNSVSSSINFFTTQGVLMKTIFEEAAAAEVLARIERLRPESERHWGSMNAAQMLAHCCVGLQMSNGTAVPSRTVLGWLIGPFFKPLAVNNAPFRRNSPTHKTFIISDARDFSLEQARLRELVKEFSRGGEAGCPGHVHAFFGYLTPAEWGILTYKHLDHHLRQFGV
jgi:hypothetical protein